jgi:hypothetical protein
LCNLYFVLYAEKNHGKGEKGEKKEKKKKKGSLDAVAQLVSDRQKMMRG